MANYRTNDGYGYRGNNNRNRNNGRQNNNNGGNKRQVSSILPKWYRNEFFNCADYAFGGEGLGTVRATNDRTERRTDPPKEKRQGGSRRFESADSTPVQNKDQQAQPKHNKENEILRNFIGDYGSHIADINYLKRLIIETFPDVLAVLRKYGDERYSDLYSSMDKVFTLMCTSQLSSLILSILEENGFSDWDDHWKNLAVAISIVISNYGNRINNTGAKSCYVNDIVPSGAMWKKEITTLTQDYKITREMAMDLVMKIPVLAEDMRTWDLNQYFIGFEWCILTHAHDNQEIMDAELQGKLFDFFFEGPNNLAPKALSRFLAAPPVIPNEEDEITEAIGSAFRQMLYEKLDKYDIEEIERTLRFVIKERKRYEAEGKAFNISLYCAAEALQFENVAKAVNNIVATDESAKQYLV